jgi:hypothetical protein
MSYSEEIFTTFENKSRFGFWVFCLGIAHRQAAKRWQKY